MSLLYASVNTEGKYDMPSHLGINNEQTSNCCSHCYRTHREDMRSDTDSSSASTFSTNYTMSGIVGAGLTVGKLYSLVGRKIENVLGYSAYKAGYGPLAVFEKMMILRNQAPEDATC